MDEKRESTAPDRYDVFISHSSIDAGPAKAICDALEGEGVSFLDPSRSPQEQWGKDLRAYLTLCIERATTVLVLFSRSYSASSWCSEELTILTSESQEDDGPRILPVRLDDAPIPAPLNSLVYLELTSCTPEEVAIRVREIVEEAWRSREHRTLLLRSDEELLKLVADKRDEEAFALLLERVRPIIRRSLHSIAYKTDIDAMDVENEVAFQLWQNAEHLASKEIPLRSYLHFMARNCGLDALRKRARIVHSKPPAPEIHLDDEHRESVDQAIKDLLTEPELALVKLRYLEDYSYEEIAIFLGSSQHAVRMRIHRALHKLRRHFAHRSSIDS